MGAIIIDENDFINTMKKLKVEVSREQDVYKLYNSNDITSRENKIHVLMLKYHRADDHVFTDDKR